MKKTDKRKFDARFVPALAELLEIYLKVTPTTTCLDAKLQFYKDKTVLCPLCLVKTTITPKDEIKECTRCPWVIMTGRGCNEQKAHAVYGTSGYQEVPVSVRIPQILEWLKAY